MYHLVACIVAAARARDQSLLELSLATAAVRLSGVGSLALIARCNGSRDVPYDETNFQRQIAPRTHVPFVVKAEDPRPASTGRLACLPTAQYYATASNL
jgi:hypothetical protein